MRNLLLLVAAFIPFLSYADETTFNCPSILNVSNEIITNMPIEWSTDKIPKQNGEYPFSASYIAYAHDKDEIVLTNDLDESKNEKEIYTWILDHKFPFKFVCFYYIGQKYDDRIYIHTKIDPKFNTCTVTYTRKAEKIIHHGLTCQ